MVTSTNVEANGSQIPACLAFNEQLKLVVCAAHVSCYVRPKFDRHIRDAQRITHEPRQSIVKSIVNQELLAELGR